MLATLHISIGIGRPFDQVYDFLSRPENFPRWASGLGQSFHALGGMLWSVETPVGVMKVQFSEPNGYGILDHTVLPQEGDPMHNPMRVIANDGGSEVIFTLFRRPGMSAEQFKADADWVRKDLATLKCLLEG